MNTLTQNQKARIFAMYLGCNVHPRGGRPELLGVSRILANNTWQAYTDIGWADLDDLKLMLRPLSSITDDDSVVVAKIGGVPPIHGDEDASLARFGRELLTEYLGSGRCNVKGQDWMQILQFLAQQGYALPLFIAPGHPDNGKTAIELGLANDLTTQNEAANESALG